MVAALAWTAFGFLEACRTESAAERPSRIVAGKGGVTVVNGRRPARIAVRVLDVRGHILPDSGVRFQWAAGIPVAVSPTGEVTCARLGDATVRVSLGRATTDVLIRCGPPVEAVRLAAPVQLLVGDTARALPVLAYGADGRTVDVSGARVWIEDSSIATLEGSRIRPLRQGTTFLSVTVGDRAGQGSVHVYEPAISLEGLDRHPRLVAVPVRLTPGEMRRWPLPAGEWMLSMWPEENEGRGPHLRVERASCVTSQISKRRWICAAKDAASVVVYAPWTRRPSATPTETLAVRPLNGQ